MYDHFTKEIITGAYHLVISKCLSVNSKHPNTPVRNQRCNREDLKTHHLQNDYKAEALEHLQCLVQTEPDLLGLLKAILRMVHFF